MEAGPGVQDHPWLQSKFEGTETNVIYVRVFFNKQTKHEKNKEKRTSQMITMGAQIHRIYSSCVAWVLLNANNTETRKDLSGEELETKRQKQKCFQI